MLEEMIEISETTKPVLSGKKLARRLRTIAVIVMLLGVAGGGLVYWLSIPPADLSDDLSTADNSKKVQRDIEVNVGKMGLFTSDLMDDLQDPGVRAGIIIGSAILVAGGCFYFARLLDLDDGEDAVDSSPR